MCHQSDDFDNFIRKAFAFQIIKCDVCILYNIMEQCNANRVLVIHLLGYVERMIHIGISLLSICSLWALKDICNAFLVGSVYSIYKTLPISILYFWFGIPNIFMYYAHL